MCNYKAETESVLQHDIFQFGLNDQTFISKISEESPDVTAVTIRQKLKKLEAGRATAKYIKGTNTIGKDPTVEGVNQVQKEGNPKGKGQKRKGWHKDSNQHSQSHPTKKPFKPNLQQGQPHRQGQKQHKPKSQASFDPNICKHCGDTRHRQSCIQGSSARNVRDTDISPASASQNHWAQMWTLLKRWMLYLHLQSSHIVCRLNSQMTIVWMQCTNVQ